MPSKEKDLINTINWLNKIGIKLSSEKNTKNLLRIILEGSMAITSSDAGSIYVVNKDADCKKFLTFVETKNFSRNFPFKTFNLPIDNQSISGACAYNKTHYKFDNIKEDVISQLGIIHNDSFDKKINYTTKNMLVVPMIDLNNETVGVLQLINKKINFNRKLNAEKDFLNEIIPYNDFEAEIILSLASQTAILFQRNILLEEKQKLFDSFVKSMVSTIERRDPTTSGHSIRVAELMMQFAKAINKNKVGKYSEVSFSKTHINSLYYAGLLHDIGKIGIKENVLLKQNRLTHSELEVIKYRFYFLKSQPKVIKLPSNTFSEEFHSVSSMDKFYDFIERINSSNFLSKDDKKTLVEMSKCTFTDVDGLEKPLLKKSELENLSIDKGNLTDSERRHIQMHSEYTHEILKDILWGKDLDNIPEITSGHHEKINGSGYPKGLKENEISMETRMLTIVDIFEALTAKDRPYKKPISVEKALSILIDEKDKNNLDKDLVDIFINSKVYNENNISKI